MEIKKPITPKQQPLVDFIIAKLSKHNPLNNLTYPTDCATARTFIGENLEWANKMDAYDHPNTIL